MEGYETKDNATIGWAFLFALIVTIAIVLLNKTRSHTHDDSGKAVWIQEE